MTGVDVLAEVGQTISKPIHGGSGDRTLHIVQGDGLGARAKDDPTVVAQKRMDVSDQTTRYVSAEPNRIGTDNPLNDQIARGAITKAIALLRGATAPTGADPGLLNAKIDGLEARLSSIPSV